MLQGKYFHELCYKGNVFMSYVTREIFLRAILQGKYFHELFVPLVTKSDAYVTNQ
jgi:hypothetical protein